MAKSFLVLFFKKEHSSFTPGRRDKEA